MADKNLTCIGPKSTRNADLGTIAWCAQTNGGQMNTLEKFSVAYGILHSGLSSVLLDITSRFYPPPDLSRTALKIPDTPASRISDEYVTNHLYEDERLLYHCRRTYCFGSLLAHDYSLADEVDHELLYVTALWHDAGLAHKYRNSLSSADFAYTGGKAMQNFALNTLKWSEARSERAADIVTLHLNPRIVANRPEGAEAFLLSAGAYVDVAGLRSSRISEKALITVLKQFPRDGFAQMMAENMSNQLLPHSRATFMGELGVLEFFAKRNNLDKPSLRKMASEYCSDHSD